MIARKVTPDQMYKALALVNRKYLDNVDFRDIEQINEKATSFRFTLRAKISRGPGGRFSMSGRRIGAAACWHVHGDFFDALFSVAPDAVVRSRAGVITREAGNWQDFNCGSPMQPLMMSQACECHYFEVGTLRPGLDGKAVLTDVKKINQASLTSDCWLIQFHGLSACDKCEIKGTKDCGGGKTLKRMQKEVKA